MIGNGGVTSTVVLLMLLIGCRSEPQILLDQIETLKPIALTLEAVDSVLRADSRIHEMDDGLRSFGTLNGTAVMKRSYTADSVVPGPYVDRYPVEAIIARDSIRTAIYDSVQAQIVDAGISYVRVTPDYSAFVIGGKLDNLNGYILVQPGGQPPGIDDGVAGARIVFIKALSPKWFYFTTS